MLSRSTPALSRSVPFLSKSTDCNLVRIATKVMLGQSLRDQGITDMRLPDGKRWYVKAPAFSFEKLTGMDAYLSPEMKSTGEAIGYDNAPEPCALQGSSGVRSQDERIRHCNSRPLPTKTKKKLCRLSSASITSASISRRPPEPRRSSRSTAYAPACAASSARAAPRFSILSARAMSAML